MAVGVFTFHGFYLAILYHTKITLIEGIFMRNCNVAAVTHGIIGRERGDVRCFNAFLAINRDYRGGSL